MSEITADKCEWCDGSGVDSEGIQLGNPYPCIDCEGTGFKQKEKGKSLYYKQMDEEEKRLFTDEEERWDDYRRDVMEGIRAGNLFK